MSRTTDHALSGPAPTTRRTQRDEPHFLFADDGVPITLIRVHAASPPTKGPVLLVHGVGMRSESFRPPVPRSIVDALLDDGWDVWMLNWRGSIDLDPRPWTLDEVATHDIPAAVRYVLERSGAQRIRAVAHCQGASALSMAAVTGLVPEIDVIVANGVSLHPVLPAFARAKVAVMLPLLGGRQPYLDAAWGDGPDRLLPWVIRTGVRTWHAECNDPACNMASFALGSGNPALWFHRNLDRATHDWLKNEFGKIPTSFYAQISASDRAGQIVSVTAKGTPPRRYAAAPPQTDARFALFAGADNRAFLPAGQKATYAYLERHQPGKHALHVIPGYRHTDVFIGRDAHRDVFPQILRELNT